MSYSYIFINVVGQTLLSSQGTTSTSYVYSHLCFLGKKVNKIRILLQGEKSHKFKVLLYAVKQKRPWRTVFLQFSKVDFYVWTNLGLVGDFTSFEAISRSPLTICVMGHTTSSSKGTNPAASQQKSISYPQNLE